MPFMRVWLDDALARARSALPAEGLEEAWRAGRATRASAAVAAAVTAAGAPTRPASR